MPDERTPLQRVLRPDPETPAPLYLWMTEYGGELYVVQARSSAAVIELILKHRSPPVYIDDAVRVLTARLYQLQPLAEEAILCTWST